MNNEPSTTNDECNITGNTLNKNDKKDLKDITREKGGIYKIINKINGKYYIGSSNNIKQRWYNHRRELNKNIHKNNYLQRAWNKYGESKFEFVLIESLSPDNCLISEQTHLNICNNNRNISYNIGKDAISPFRGLHHSPETILKIIKSNTGRKWSMQQKETRSKKMKWKYTGNKNPNFGKRMPPKTKLSILKSRMDMKIYCFKHTISSEIFKGTRHEFRMYIHVGRDSIHQLVNGIIKSCKKWIIQN